MNRFSWPYVAGLFDGEGHLSMSKGRGKFGEIYPYAGISQAGPMGHEALKEVQSWLRSNGVKCGLVRHIKRNHQRMDCFGVTVQGRGAVHSFVNGILPYVIIKRSTCQDFMRFMRLYPSLNKGKARSNRNHCEG